MGKREPMVYYQAPSPGPIVRREPPHEYRDVVARGLVPPEVTPPQNRLGVMDG
jgi:hypothetical protein